MKKNVRNIIDTLLKFKELATLVGAILLWFLGVWFTYRIAPLNEAISGLESNVRAVEGRVDLHDKNIEAMDSKLDEIIRAVGRLEGKCSN